MEKSNIIISIIVVLCIAASVTAYGLMNPNDNIFSNLAGLDGGGSDGLGNNTSGNNTLGSGSGSGSSSVNSNKNRPQGPKITESDATIIAKNTIKEDGWYPGKPVYSYSTNKWTVAVYDSTGALADSLQIDGTTGAVDRG